MITSTDAGLVRYGVSPARYDETVFCSDRVRYVGDDIAAVAAVDPETAEAALSLIKVDYEELPAVLTIAEAMAEGAYSSFGIATVYYAGSLLGGPYKLPNMKYDGWRIYTNKPTCGAQRGHGG